MAEINNVIAEASQDLQTIEDFVNLPADSKVYPRLLPSVNVGTLAGTRDAIFRAGGLPAEPFETKAQMTSEGASLPDGQLAMVHNDTANNGLYVKTAGTWVNSAYDPIDSALGKFGGLGYGVIIGSIPNNINYITSSGDLNLSGSVYVFSSTKMFILSTPTNVKFNTSGVQRLEFNTELSTLRAVPFSTQKEANWITLAVVSISPSRFTTNDIVGYTVDGTANNQYSYSKLLAFNVDAIEINTTTKKMTTRATGRISLDGVSDTLSSSTIDLPTVSGVYRIEYDFASKQVMILPTTATQISTSTQFARLRVSGSTYTLFGVDVYKQDGATIIGGYASSAPTPPNGSGTKSGTLLASEPSNLDFNFNSRTLTITPNRVRLIYNGTSILLPAATVDISTDYELWTRLIYNTVSKGFSTRRASLPMLDNEMMVAQLHVLNKTIEGVPYYTVGGKPPSSGSDTLSKANYLLPYGSTDFVDLPEQTALNAVYTEHKFNLSTFYGLYDALVTAYPDYITMTVLGTDSLSREIRQYRFNAPEVPKTASIKKPKVILCSNVHGEQAGVFNLYNVMRIICEDWSTNESLETLRWGTDIIVIPVAVPHIFVQAGRKNPNGVDIARNFEAGWSFISDTESQVYAGTAPLSEIESQILNSVMTNNKDAILFASLHSFTATTTPELPNGSFVWNAACSEYGISLAKALITKHTISAKRRYDFLEQSDNAWLGYTDMTAPAGSEGRQAVIEHGIINGSTFEICGQLHQEEGKPFLSSAATTLAAEAVINWVLINLKHSTGFSNTSINI